MNKNSQLPSLAATLRVLNFCGRIFSVLLLFCALAVPLGYFAMRIPASQQTQTSGKAIFMNIELLLAAVVIFYILFLFCRRSRNPFRAALITGIAQIFLPLGAPLAFFLPETLRKCTPRTNIKLIALHLVGFTINIWRDLQGWNTDTSFLRIDPKNSSHLSNISNPANLDIFKLFILLLIVMVIPIWIGLWSREKLQVKQTQETAEKERIAGVALQNEILNRDQRDALARNIHDTIGRKLSLISLYAGGLEVSKNSDEKLAKQARQMRETAQEAVVDLHNLVTMMRENTAEVADAEKVAPSLANLSTLINHSVQAQQKIISAISLQNLETAGACSAEATYFIVAEILTNAAKHAPQSTLQLKVSGSASQGISISAENELAENEENAENFLTTGYGMKGIAERVEILGGSIQQKTEAGYFKTHIWLPWK